LELKWTEILISCGWMDNVFFFVTFI
jgi:hypothetical protein